MLMWALPDVMVPLRLGGLGGKGTHALRLHSRPDQAWFVSANGTYPNTPYTTYPPANELWAVILHNNPRCAAVRLAMVQSQVQMNLDVATVTESLSLGPFRADGANDTYSGWVPLFVKGDGFGTGWWSDGTLATGGGAKSDSTLVLTRSGGTFSSANKYVMQFAIFTGVTVVESAEVVVTGTDSASITFTLPAAPGYCFANYLGAFAAGSGLQVGSEDSMQLSSAVVYQPGLWNTVGQWHVVHDPLPGTTYKLADACRINAARIVATPTAPALTEDGDDVGVELPNNEFWTDYVLNPMTGGWYSSVHDQVKADSEAGIKARGDAKDPGASDCWHPNGFVDFSPDIGEPDDAIVQYDDNFVPLSDLSGGVMIVERTSLAGTTSRAGMWQFYWHFEFRTESQDYTMEPPNVSLLSVIRASEIFETHSAFTGNPTHVVTGVKKVAATTLQVGGPAAMAAGGAMLAVPGAGTLPGALTIAGGALATAIGSLLS